MTISQTAENRIPSGTSIADWQATNTEKFDYVVNLFADADNWANATAPGSVAQATRFSLCNNPAALMQAATVYDWPECDRILNEQQCVRSQVEAIVKGWAEMEQQPERGWVLYEIERLIEDTSRLEHDDWMYVCSALGYQTGRAWHLYREAQQAVEAA